MRSHPALSALLLASGGALAYALLRFFQLQQRNKRTAKGKAKAKAKAKGARNGAGLGFGAAAAAGGGRPSITVPGASASSSAAAAAAAASSPSSEDERSSPVTPVGFRNVGNSCYLNALLQVRTNNQRTHEATMHRHTGRTSRCA